jgi:hypothetical protein
MLPPGRLCAFVEKEHHIRPINESKASKMSEMSMNHFQAEPVSRGVKQAKRRLMR